MKRLTKVRALELCTRKWGRTAWVRDLGAKYASTPESRAAAMLELRAHRAVKPELLKVTDVDPGLTVGEYIRLAAQRREQVRVWREREDQLQAYGFRRRFDVGTSSRLFNEIKGSGDTWEEALRTAGILPVVMLEPAAGGP